MVLIIRSSRSGKQESQALSDVLNRVGITLTTVIPEVGRGKLPSDDDRSPCWCR